MNSMILVVALSATTGLFGGGKQCGGGKMHHAKATRGGCATMAAPAPCGYPMMTTYSGMPAPAGTPAMTTPASTETVPPAPKVPMASPGGPPIAPPKPAM